VSVNAACSSPARLSVSTPAPCEVELSARGSHPSSPVESRAGGTRRVVPRFPRCRRVRSRVGVLVGFDGVGVGAVRLPEAEELAGTVSADGYEQDALVASVENEPACVVVAHGVAAELVGDAAFFVGCVGVGSFGGGVGGEDSVGGVVHGGLPVGVDDVKIHRTLYFVKGAA